jgi:hypothetical protein
MNRDDVIVAFHDVFCYNKTLACAVFGTCQVPDKIENYTLAISSLEFVELIIEVGDRLNIKISEDILLEKVTIMELVERVLKNA